MTPGRKRFAFGLLLLLPLLLFAAHGIRQFWVGDAEDFNSFYLPAQAMRKGEDIYAAAQGQYIYPPLLAFLLQPLTFVVARMAATIWSFITVVLIFAAFFIASKEVTRRWHSENAPSDSVLPWKTAALSALLMGDKLHEIFTLGQTDGLMLLGFALLLRWMNRKPALAGIATGATANIKYLSLIFVPYFVIKRNFRAAISSCVAFVFFLGFPMLETGFARGLDYAFVALRGIGGIFREPDANIRILEVTWGRSVSLTSTMFRLVRAHQLPDFVALLLLILISCALLTALIAIGRHYRVPLFQPMRGSDAPQTAAVESLEWAALIILAVIFSPQTTPRHMVLVSLVYTVALAIFFTVKETGVRLTLAGALALMTLGLSYPLRGTPLDNLLQNWRPMGGASWCAIVLLLVLTWAGCRVLVKISPVSPNE